MKERFRLSEFGKAISLSQTISYLDSNGWKIHMNEKPIRCEGPEDDAGEPIVAFIPSDDTLRDFPLRLEDLIILLSELEERPAVLIANDIAGIHRRDDTIPRTLTGFFDILKKHVRNAQPERTGEQYSRTLFALAESVELALGGGKTMAVALLLKTCAKMDGKFEEPKLLLWRLADWSGIFLKKPTPAKLDELHQIAVSSSIESDSLFEWLNANRAEDVEVPDQSNELKPVRKTIDQTD